MNASPHLFCAPCGAAVPLHARFCPLCGHALQAASVEQEGSVGGIQELSPATSSAAKVHVTTVLPMLVTPPRPVVAQGAAAQNSLLKQRYRLLRKIGAGGYGDVYKAADTQFGDRVVAIKEMSQRGLKPQEVVEASEAFKREAFLLAALTHPGLPSIYDYFSENERWYLVMSFIEGETLEDYLARAQGQRLLVEKVLHIGTQLAGVLSYLHTRNPPIIFRDLKPSNIMRTPDGQIYLIDFGIARHFKIGQSKDTAALGSPGYAAPEQYGRAQTTPQADVYSLGVTLHQMLSGSDPAQSPFNLSPLRLPAYPQLSILIACMLDMDVKKRPSSMGNIKRELQRIATGRSHGARNSHPRRFSAPVMRVASVYAPAPQQAVQIVHGRLESPGPQDAQRD